MKKSRIQAFSSPSAFTLIELLVVIGIIALLAAMLFPALTGARIRSYDADCSSNLKQIGTALYGYSGEHGSGFFPAPDTTSGADSYGGPQRNLVQALRDYIPGDSPVWHCKRYLRINNIAISTVQSNTTYFYWAWNMVGETLAPMTITSTRSRWSSIAGLTTNLPGAVLLSDQFETSALGDTRDRQYHSGTKLDAQSSQPGTMVLLIGGAAMKISPTHGMIE